MKETKITATRAAEIFPELIAKAGYAKEVFVITKHGKDLAKIIPANDAENENGKKKR
jgi:hypothetical protein